ncbi:MAG: proton-conducting membrane transporter [Gammaproteobacteria bacterium]|nr:proton-conducting membrane transporter [Gammaproteobacteria bacterium]
MPFNQPYGVRSFYAPGHDQGPKAVPAIVGRGPSSFAAYAAAGGFRALQRLQNGETTPVAVLKQILASGLRGCGGSHLPLVKKWEAAIPHKPRYLVVNGMEGEPDTFKDYLLLRDYPQIVLEGIALACRVLHIREACLVLNSAYGECRAALQAVLNENAALFDGLDIQLVDGPEVDLYVAGEESALLNYLEGQRAEPRLKPPFPHEQGLWGKPTIINNVETLSWLPLLLVRPELFAGRHPKLVTLLGDVAEPGIYEITLGEPLPEILQRARADDLSFVEIGGISGGLIPATLTNVDYDDEALAPLGVQVGSGTLRVFNTSRDPLAEMAAAIAFFKTESCGRCTPCRVGTQELAKFAAALRDTPLSNTDLNWVHSVAHTLQQTSTCGLGRAAPAPLLTWLHHFGKKPHD